MLEIILYNFDIAIDAIKQNKLRSILTSLGIIFGVASVIAMLAIGQGAQQEVLMNMQVLGTNNIIIRPVMEQRQGTVEEEVGDTEESADGEGANRSRRFSPGLTMEDMASIIEQVPLVENISPEIVNDVQIVRAGRMRTGKLVGVNEQYFSINQSQIASGSNFSLAHLERASPVVVIGDGVRIRFFPGENPIGQQVKAGNVWYTIIGVLQPKNLTASQIDNLGIRDYNMDIYAPVTTTLLRLRDRAQITESDLGGWGDEDNYHQLDQLIARVSDSSLSITVSEIISRLLQRRHNNVIDFEIIVPELLLQQEQRTKRIFNIVLASIASISLIVGGIGIMNIMLASVVERYREIGVRMAVGAQKRDIRYQFLTEALVISVFGGFIGIVVGFAFSLLIEATAGIVTIVTFLSILISFGVATSIGVIFGYFPAKRAAAQDPVHALRHE
ncbi:MAG: ABC transporter permease [Balneolaceae bacterium]